MEPPRTKRSRSLQASKTKFLDLDDYCILNILMKLSPTDLCSMSFTSKRMQQLTHNQFYHEDTDRFININASSNSEIHFYVPCPNQKYTKYLAKCIRNVRIIWYDVKAIDLFDFIRSECCETLEYIELYGNGRLKGFDGESIKQQLKSVKSVRINGTHVRSDIYNGLLKYCQNLKSFKMVNAWNEDSYWMLQQYPKLEEFGFISAYEGVNQFDLLGRTFFQLNPKLKCFVCSAYYLKTILQNAINVESLTVIEWTFNSAIEELKAYLEQSSTINRLEFKVISGSSQLNHSLDLFAELNKSVHPIHELTFTKHSRFLNDSFYTLKQLVVLSMVSNFDIIQDIKNLLESVARELPNLVKFHLDFRHFSVSLNDRQPIAFKSFVMPVVENSVKLKELTLSSGTITYKYNRNDLLELTNARLKSSNTCSIAINIDYQRFLERGFEPPIFDLPTKTLVQIKLCSNPVNYFDVHNSFIF